jgi:prepilin-type N-terminal cleavage/methylation domain-containing protein
MHPNTTNPTRPRRRPGFTLIELLVVLSLILFVTGIAVLFVPSALDNTRAAEGGSRLQNMLIMAQQRAMLDRAPVGIRLLNNAGTNVVTQVQMVARPDDYTGGTIFTNLTPPSAPPIKQIYFSADQDLSGGNGQGSNQSLWPVQPGDYIEVQKGGLMHQITAVGYDTNVNLWYVVIYVPPGGAGLPADISVPTADYRIERAPRVLGDETMQMPDNIGIDLNTNVQYGNPLPPQNNPAAPGCIDIIFSPRGEMLGNTGADRIILWVRDYQSYTDPTLGEPTLVVVFPRSGKAAAYPVNLDPNYQPVNGQLNPYALIK